MNISSPYDFIEKQTILPHEKQCITILTAIIDFCLSLPELRTTSAEGIFFGSLVYACIKKS